MKRVFALLLALLLSLTAVAAFAEGETTKLGFAVVTDLSGSKSAEGADGQANVDSAMVAVLLDAEGKILNCRIDGVQSAIGFSAEGKLTSDSATTFATKQEIGADYGMAKASPIGKEWFEQVDALAAYAVGKTADELLAMTFDERGASTDADVLSGATISIAGLVQVMVQACEAAQPSAASNTDKLGLGTFTHMSKSKDATADAEGQAQAYATYAVVALDDSGKITGCLIDSTQGTVKFDGAGKITSDITAGVQTKQAQGDDYGMRKASAIGKEWNEQANAFAAYAIGKTDAELLALALNEKGGATDVDLMASVTVSVSPFLKAIDQAAQTAR